MVGYFPATALPPEGHTYRTYALQTDEIVCDLNLDETITKE